MAIFIHRSVPGSSQTTLMMGSLYDPKNVCFKWFFFRATDHLVNGSFQVHTAVTKLQKT